MTIVVCATVSCSKIIACKLLKGIEDRIIMLLEARRSLVMRGVALGPLSAH